MFPNIFQLFSVRLKLNFILIGLFAIRIPIWVFTAARKHSYYYWSVLILNSAGIDIGFIVDLRSTLFFTTVSLISFAVFRFSYSYIAPYKFFSRFTILLFIFVLSIIILIFASNLIFIMLGWDGLGVRSYLLVIYYGSTKSYNAGIITVMRNRLGDVALIFRIGLIIQLGRWRILFYKDFRIISYYFPLLLSLGAFTKRAQIPFSAWLPSAMAAPTPVSSLVHSSTLVTAGVYLLFRHFSDLLFVRIQSLMGFLGVRTILIARVAAINEKDIKKIVALSTLSQLGLIISSLGCKWVFIAFFHLIIHAFFKAMIFIRVGNLIHLRQNYQALKNRGSLNLRRPLNNSSLIVARFSLCGAPFAAAFFSKEPIVELSLYRSNSLGLVRCVLLSLYLTLLYRFRLLKLVVINFINLRAIINLTEEDPLLVKGILVLLIPSFSRGSVLGAIIIKSPLPIAYVNSVKYMIFLRFLVSLIILLLSSYKIHYKIQSVVFPMWGIMIYTASLFNYKQQVISFHTNNSNFGFFLNNFIRRVNIFARIRTIMMTSNLIIRIVSIIPLFIILYAVL